MSVSWWNLPGPHEYAQSIIRDLRDGKNVLAVFPTHGCEGLRDCLQRLARDSELHQWTTLRASSLPTSGMVALTEAVHQSLALDSPPSSLKDIPQLAASMRGNIVCIQGIDPSAWELWLRFISQYQHASQHYEIYERGLFCLELNGVHTPTPTADTALSVRRWDNIVGRLDMMLFVDHLLGTSGCRNRPHIHPIQHQTAVAVITELAGSDDALAYHLIDEPLEVLMDPHSTLTSYGASRGWSPGERSSNGWATGIIETINGVERRHSAAVAIDGDQAEIMRRVWRGQVSVLYPFIEEQRIRLLPRVRGYLRFPLETTYGIIQSPEDLELGPLLHFLRGRNIETPLWKRLNHLTQMRHDLAHLTPVSATHLSSAAFSRDDSF